MAPLILKALPNHGNLTFRVDIQPAEEAITADDVKNWGKIDTDAEDTIIENLIIAVRQTAESWLGRALLEQTIISTFDWWPENPVKLPRPPLISVSSVVTVDEEDNETEYDSSNYFIQTGDICSLIVRNNGSPPTNTDRYFGGFKITHKNGYGDEVADVPQLIKQGLIEWTLNALENRIVSRIPPDGVLDLLEAYRIRRI